MVRTLLLITAVSFVLAVVCFLGAFAIVGGPFYIGTDREIHHTTWVSFTDD